MSKNTGGYKRIKRMPFGGRRERSTESSIDNGFSVRRRRNRRGEQLWFFLPHKPCYHREYVLFHPFHFSLACSPTLIWKLENCSTVYIHIKSLLAAWHCAIEATTVNSSSNCHCDSSRDAKRAFFSLFSILY
jgi:hypothetical protein